LLGRFPGGLSGREPVRLLIHQPLANGALYGLRGTLRIINAVGVARSAPQTKSWGESWLALTPSSLIITSAVSLAPAAEAKR